jgi:hypothetical protein
MSCWRFLGNFAAAVVAAVAAAIAYIMVYCCQAVSLQNNEFQGPAKQLGKCRLVALDISVSNRVAPDTSSW